MHEPEAQLIPDIPASPGPEGTPASGSLPALKAYLAQLLKRYTEEHPEVVATKMRIARLESELKAAEAAKPEPEPAPDEAVADSAPASSPDFLVSDLTAQVAAVDRDITVLQDRYNEIQGHIGRYQTRVEKIPEVEQELQSLERDYELISRYYSELLSRKLEAETAGAVERRWQEERFKILDPAQVAESPEFPKPSLFLLVGTLIGLGAGVALGFLLEVIEPSVKNLRELENLLPYPVLLTLPHMKEPRTRFQRRRRDPSPPAPPASEDVGERRLSAAS
jgi:uncharacterized protein involved in exopolysaccharide biosynthesis